MSAATTYNTASDLPKSLIETHLDWSDKQRRILTADGKAVEYFSQFTAEDLPHAFLTNRTAGQTLVVPSLPRTLQSNLLVGVWKRLLFYGGWEYSTEASETVFNIQTNTLFVDLRIPTTRDLVLGTTISAWTDCTADQLRYAARQHVFAGSSRVTDTPMNAATTKDDIDVHDGPYPAYCTRFHAVDWNYFGVGRNRPNQWWIEPKPAEPGGDFARLQEWKEWAFAKDPQGQYYYCEQWQAAHKTQGLVLSLYCEEQEGIIVVVDDHFNFCWNRLWHNELRQLYDHVAELYPSARGSSVGAIDAAVADDNLELARTVLSRIAGGHGRLIQNDRSSSTLWMVDLATEPWMQGASLWTGKSVVVEGSDLSSCQLRIGSETWKLYEHNLSSVDDVRALFAAN